MRMRFGGKGKMDLQRDPADEDFRDEVRAFLETDWVRAKLGETPRPRGRDSFVLSASILGRKRWTAPGWPTQWGGANLSPVRRYILEEELVKARFPSTDRIAINLAGPVIYTFGTLEQKKRYLPKVLTGEEIWCQGFSEPESGSDVNSLRTKAVRQGDFYVVQGRKLWTTNAHFADMMFGLVRTEIGDRRQHGLTFMLIDMRQPGVSVRPIITLDSRHHVNEVLLDEVRVPISNVVGEVGRGWHNARFLLANERVMVSQVPRARQSLAVLKLRAASAGPQGAKLIKEPGFQRRLAQLEIDLLALEFTVHRVLHGSRDDPSIEPLACVLKFRAAEFRQRVSELSVEALGDHGLTYYSSHPDDRSAPSSLPPGPDYAPLVVREFLFNLSATIAAGTSEVQRNLIAGVALGL